MNIQKMLESLSCKFKSERYRELETENRNFIRKCEEQAKQVFYERSTHIPAEMLDCTAPSLYHIEINSQCNLKCKLCGAGNTSALQLTNGVMKLPYFKKLIEKIGAENDKATILPFGNSEPFLNKNICEYIKIIKERGLKCTLSSNLNIFSNVESVMKLDPDVFIISISGYNQQIYSIAHRCGNIETVKENMKKISEIKYKNNLKTNIVLNYHIYKYNWGSDFESAKKLAGELGFLFSPNCARSISMEMTLQYMSQLERGRLGEEPTKLPFTVPLPQTFYEGIDSLIVKPEDTFEMYQDIPSAIVCPFTYVETYIRADGAVQLCGCCSDRRLILAPDYLKTSQEELQRKRRWHPFCEVCLRTKTYLYFNMVDLHKWDSVVRTRIPHIPADRLLLGNA